MVTNNSSNIPTAASGKVAQGAGVGSALTFSTPTYPSSSGSAGKILRSDGTNNVYSTATYPDTAGTSGNLLTSDGTNWSSSAPPTPGAGGGWFLIQTQTASSSATIDFTTGITTTYAFFVFMIADILPATANTSLSMLYSTDGGATYISSLTYMNGASAGNGVTVSVNQSNADPGLVGSIWNYNVATSTATYSYVNMMYWDNSGPFTNQQQASTNKTNTTVNAFRFIYSSGNIASGTISLYGIKK